jgi:uncharacterized membrane protein YesL
MSTLNASRKPASLHVVANAIRDWYDDWINLFLINVLLLLAWLTVVLGPPVTFGLYHVTNQLAHGRSGGPRDLLAAAWRYFGQSWLWMAINLVAAVLLFVNYVFYRQVTSTWSLAVQAIFLALALLWLVVQFYTVPYLMEQEKKSLKIALRNGLFTSLAAPAYTFVLVGLAGLVIALSLVFVLPLALASPCLVACLGNRAVIDRIETFGVRERDLARQTRPEQSEEKD